MHLAFFEDQRHESVMVLELKKVSDPVWQDYQSGLIEFLNSETQEGVQPPSVQPFDLVHMKRGSRDIEWSHLAAYPFDSGQDLVSLHTAAQYRDLKQAAYAESSLSLVVFDAQALREAADKAWVVVLIEPRENSAVDTFAALEPYIASGSVDVLSDASPYAVHTSGGTHERWQRMLVLGFADWVAASTWLSQPAVELEIDLLNSRVRDLAILLYKPS